MWTEDVYGNWKNRIGTIFFASICHNKHKTDKFPTPSYTKKQLCKNYRLFIFKILDTVTLTFVIWTIQNSKLPTTQRWKRKRNQNSSSYASKYLSALLVNVFEYKYNFNVWVAPYQCNQNTMYNTNMDF